MSGCLVYPGRVSQKLFQKLGSTVSFGDSLEDDFGKYTIIIIIIIPSCPTFWRATFFPSRRRIINCQIIIILLTFLYIFFFRPHRNIVIATAFRCQYIIVFMTRFTFVRFSNLCGSLGSVAIIYTERKWFTSETILILRSP